VRAVHCSDGSHAERPMGTHRSGVAAQHGAVRAVTVAARRLRRIARRQYSASAAEGHPLSAASQGKLARTPPRQLRKRGGHAPVLRHAARTSQGGQPGRTRGSRRPSWLENEEDRAQEVEFGLPRHHYLW